MTDYQFYSLIISIFTAVGTCGATALALYFWLQGKKLKLNFHSMHAEGYGAVPNIDGGYLVLKFTNTGYDPINLELAGLKFNNKCYFHPKSSIILCGHSNENLSGDVIPKILQHGPSYIYSISWNDFISLCKSMGNKKLITAFACISSRNGEVRFKLDKYVLTSIRNDLKK